MLLGLGVLVAFGLGVFVALGFGVLVAFAFVSSGVGVADSEVFSVSFS